ncbi:MAG: hypothetical protein D6769_02285, partial [Methanobacteriota archaeon]
MPSKEEQSTATSLLLDVAVPFGYLFSEETYRQIEEAIEKEDYWELTKILSLTTGSTMLDAMAIASALFTSGSSLLTATGLKAALQRILYETTVLGLGRELRKVPSLIAKAPEGTAEMVRTLRRIFTKRDAEDVLSLAERGRVYLRAVNEWTENILSKEGVTNLFFKHRELTTDGIELILGRGSLDILREEGLRATASILDKGKTWFMNTFGREVGDAILGFYRAITLDAIDTISRKYPDVVIRYLPQGGDEALILVVGKNDDVKTAEIMTELTGFIKRDMESVLASLAQRHPRFRDFLGAWTEVDNIDLDILLSLDKNNQLNMLSDELGEVGSLYEALSIKESNGLLEKLSKISPQISISLKRLRDRILSYNPSTS